MAVDVNNIKTDYLGQKGLYDIGALNINDLDAVSQKAIQESDRHQILDDGTVAFVDNDGSTQLVPESGNENNINISGLDASAVAELADLKYLAQNTGVKTSDLNAAYEKLGIAGSTYSGTDIDNTSLVANDILKAFGYNPGEQSGFYGNTSGPSDIGAQILYDRWSQAPSDEELEAAGLDPEKYSIVNSNVANQVYLQNKLQETGGTTKANFANLREGQTLKDNRDNLDRLISEGNPESYWSSKSKQYDLSPSEMQLDMTEWDLIKKKAEETGVDTKGYTSAVGNVNLTGGVSQTGGNTTGGGTGDGAYTGPNFVSTPNIGVTTPVYGADQTGLTEVDIPTYEAGLGLQQTQFEDRSQQQQQFYQPQTLAEQQAAGTAPAFENVLYRNRFGMSMYIQHINGVPSQPIPPGYYRVQGFGTEAQTQGGSAAAAQGQNQGGMIQSFSNGGLPEGVTIKKYGNRYGYADPFGNRIDVRDAQGNIVTYQNPEYALSGASSNPDVTSALEPYNPYSGDLNPAMNYQPGGQIIQADGGYKIQYPGEGGATSQLFNTYGQAVAANQAGLSGLGLPDYQTYLTQQGINTANPGYDPAAYQSAYQSYISDPSTLANTQVQQEAAEKADQPPETGGINADQPTGQMDVTAEDLAQSQRDLVAQATVAPGGAVAAAPVSYIDPNAYGTVMDSTTGQALGTAPMVQEDQVAQIGSATTADVPTGQGAATYDANQAFGDVQQATEGMTAATSDGPSKTIDAAQQTGSSLTGLTSATRDSINVTGAPTRELETMGGQSELITGTGVDQSKVMAAFGEGEIKAASVQDELTGLMQQFEGGETPAWAAGSMRSAMATLAARGLGASSMAGQAVIQAAMEAALPIAQIDASNKQQMALFKGEQRAKFLQMDFDQAFQAKVMNAAKVSEIANMNFTAEQQIALENSKAANTMQLQNLSNEQALVMAEAAALSQMDMANLNNRQQAAIQNAQNFLQIDMANLANEQATALFKQQSLVNSILSDQAASNAAAQFNATSENQTNQFFSNLAASVNQFNAAQMNAMKQFNADEVNSLLEFNASIQNQREMFNAQNYLVVAQANAQWRQNLATINTAAANEANMDYAQTVNGLTIKTLDEIWQRERDLMDYSFTSSENAADRALSILLGDKQLSAVQQQLDSQEDQALGSLLTKVFFSSGFKSIFDSSE